MLDSTTTGNIVWFYQRHRYWWTRSKYQGEFQLHFFRSINLFIFVEPRL